MKAKRPFAGYEYSTSSAEKLYAPSWRLLLREDFCSIRFLDYSAVQGGMFGGLCGYDDRWSAERVGHVGEIPQGFAWSGPAAMWEALGEKCAFSFISEKFLHSAAEMWRGSWCLKCERGRGIE